MPVLCSENIVHKGQTLLVWDADGLPPCGDWTTILWSSYGNSSDPDTISIPKLVEEQADALRSRYLAWVHELGETFINGKRVIDHLELRPGFSYWWMTSVAQKFNASGTSQIDNAIKSLVLEGLISEKTPTSILLVSGNDKIASVLQDFCDGLGVSFTWKRAKPMGKPKLSVARLIYNSLPSPVRAIIYLLWCLFRNISFRRAKPETALAANAEITFIDVLVHLDRRAFTTGTFVSNYWTSLVDKLSHSNVKTNWLHNYFSQKAIPTLTVAQDLTKSFNETSQGMQSHMLLESNLTLPVFITALKDYVKTAHAVNKDLLTRQHFKPSGSRMNFWPLFRGEWIDSVRGQGAMTNCLRYALYEKSLRCIPYQRIGVYIQENQPWEMALIHSWRSAGHGKLIGVPHTNARYWDLRYFYDFRSYERTGKNDLPMPDLVAVNGPVANNSHLEGRYPVHRLIEVEALRFLHLLVCTPTNSSKKADEMALNVLVCGDFLPATTHKMLSWLVEASKALPSETTYIFKQHPAYPINLDPFNSLQLKTTTASWAELFADCDVAFTSNTTSAAVDAYCAGIPVIQLLDGNSLNLSPLRGINGVTCVTNPKELAEAFIEVKCRDHVVPEPYFYLDEGLPRWQNITGVLS